MVAYLEALKGVNRQGGILAAAAVADGFASVLIRSVLAVCPPLF